MRNTLMMSAAVLGLTAGAAFAQNAPAQNAPQANMAPETSAPTQVQGTVRPGHQPGVGNSEPSSSQASNINGSDTRSTIAPRLPSRSDNGSVQDYLRDAQRALSHRQTGAAQEALERAQTRLLDRSVLAGETNTPTDNPMVATLEQARQALAHHDMATATRLIGQALASNDTSSQPNGGAMAAPTNGTTSSIANDGAMGSPGAMPGTMPGAMPAAPRGATVP